MPKYYVFRVSDNAPNAVAYKPQIFREITEGKLRQGKCGAIPLINRNGGIVTANQWRQRARNLWDFGKRTYPSLGLMLEIQPDDRLIVPTLDADGGSDGFVVATAREAPANANRRRRCYFHNGHAHFVSVDPNSVEQYQNGEFQGLARSMRAYRFPVQRIVNGNLTGQINDLQPDDNRWQIPNFDPNAAAAGREMISQQIAARRGQGAFRRKVLQAYGLRCALSGADAVEAL